jgi:hypothetical protein
MLLALVLAVPASATDIDDAAMARQCPAAAAWMKAHPHPVADPVAMGSKGAITQPALHDELLRMADEDQKTRDAMIAAGMRDKSANLAVGAADARHLRRLQQIVAAQGFPTASQVGTDGMHAAWLLVQHADSDPAFQAQMLAAVEPQVGHGVRAQDFALLTDRVLTAQGKPQRFGTQFAMRDGALQADPIDDAAHVDQRRAGVGLMPLGDYACMLQVVYGVPQP